MNDPLVLGPELSIRTAAATHQQLQAAATSGDLHLDLSAVTELDTAGLQVLLCAARAATVHLHQPSPTVTTILELAGLDTTLHPTDPPAAPPPPGPDTDPS
jgi:anti-anti-sigma factor